MPKTFAVITIAALPLLSGPAGAALELVEQNTKTVGATVITWDSSLRDLDYEIGTTLEAEIHWAVDAGAATFSNFRLRGPNFTPKGPDPAAGFLLGVDPPQDSTGQGSSGAVLVRFQLTELHCDADRQMQIGNAHFALDLTIDQDGDGGTDSVVAYGVNVHVENLGPCDAAAGGPPPGRGPRGPNG